MDLKNKKRGRIKEYAQKYNKAQYLGGEAALGHQVRRGAARARRRTRSTRRTPRRSAKNGCICVAEGANMPTTIEGMRGPPREEGPVRPRQGGQRGWRGDSGLEMSQNSMRLSWTRQEVDEKLKGIMHAIHTTVHEGSEGVQRAGELRDGRQHRRLREGRRRDDRPGAGLIARTGPSPAVSSRTVAPGSA